MSFFSIVSPIIASPIITSISGNPADGSLVTITGNNFGTKSPAAPLIWETHEVGSFSGDWGNSMKDRDMLIGSTAEINRHSKSSYYGYDQFDMYSAYRYAESYSNTWYINFWFRLGSAWVYSGSGSPDYMSNIKTTLLWNAGVQCVLSTCGYPATASWNGGWHCGPRADYNQYETAPITQQDIWPNIETWYSQQIVFKDSTTSSSGDGVFEAWANGTRYLSDHTANLYGGGNTYPLDAGWIDAWNENCPGGECAKIYYDDIYIDTTLSRVMIGNNATLANCTHQEIQIPSAWSGNSITITVNQGSFANCESAYLFVVDANGNVNTQGYPVRIVTGAGEPPCPPIGLKIK